MNKIKLLVMSLLVIVWQPNVVFADPLKAYVPSDVSAKEELKILLTDAHDFMSDGYDLQAVNVDIERDTHSIILSPLKNSLALEPAEREYSVVNVGKLLPATYKVYLNYAGNKRFLGQTRVYSTYGSYAVPFVDDFEVDYDSKKKAYDVTMEVTSDDNCYVYQRTDYQYLENGIVEVRPILKKDRRSSPACKYRSGDSEEVSFQIPVRKLGDKAVFMVRSLNSRAYQIELSR